MRYHEIICEDEELMSYWDLVRHYKLGSAAESLHDATLPWINYNDHRRITKLVTNKNMRKLSKLRMFTEMHVQNFAQPFATPAQFEAALSQPITMWRGGGDVYDPAHEYRHGWTSFTTKEGRAETFSKYDGTRAMRSYRLPLRDQYWVVKLTIPLDSILLYLPHGNDQEVIVSADDARKAQVVTQTEKGMARASA